MLTILGPDLVRHEPERSSSLFCEEYLFFKHPFEGIFETLNLHGDAPREHCIAGRGRLVDVQKQILGQTWRMVSPTGCDAKFVVKIPIQRGALPRIPYRRSSVDHTQRGICLQLSNLIEKLVREPYIIGIEEANILSVCLGNPEIAALIP
jgi:hypothetical protein